MTIMRSALLIVMVAIGCKSAPPAADQPEPPATRPDSSTSDAGKPDIAPLDGAELYGRVCVTCHGTDGDGKGLEQPLFSFGSPEQDWKNGPTVEGILTTLSEGVHDTSMAAFPGYGEAERRALATYVLSLRAELTGP